MKTSCRAEGGTHREGNEQELNGEGSLGCQNILLAGPSSSGKSSILLDMACAVAGKGGQVLFVTHQESMCKNALYHCTNPNTTATRASCRLVYAKFI